MAQGAAWCSFGANRVILMKLGVFLYKFLFLLALCWKFIFGCNKLLMYHPHGWVMSQGTTSGSLGANNVSLKKIGIFFLQNFMFVKHDFRLKKYSLFA
jgi:hypothetical protein